MTDLQRELEILQAEARALGKARLFHGREVGDPVPMSPPIGYRREPSLVERIKAMVRSELLAREVSAQGFETAEEADDFEVGDDYDPTSPYEHDFDPAPRPAAAEPLSQGAEPASGGAGGDLDGP